MISDDLLKIKNKIILELQWNKLKSSHMGKEEIFRAANIECLIAFHHLFDKNLDQATINMVSCASLLWEAGDTISAKDAWNLALDIAPANIKENLLQDLSLKIFKD